VTRLVDRTILFADLRGSTALFETLGNAQATALVTQSIARVAQPVVGNGGLIVKTLGDGLMALFDDAKQAVQCALRMQEHMDVLGLPTTERPVPLLPRSLRLQVAIASGKVVEMADDCYGDAVNVAARLLDHASDGEIMVTQRIYDVLPEPEQARFRHIDQIVLRGRAEPLSVYVLGGRRALDSHATAFAEAPLTEEPDGIRLSFSGSERLYDSERMPIVMGRSPQSSFCVEDARVSRSHARLDWHGGSFQLTDLSSNGTYVRFADGEVVSLRRGSCSLHGQGRIGLGGSPADAGSAVVRFEVVRTGDSA
jgi:adenylate cyclase